jgi:putative peptidoglycan lipid II flippase
MEATMSPPPAMSVDADMAPTEPAEAAAPTAPKRAGSARRMAALLMLGALASKILGFLREILMARTLGASLLADSYRGAVTAILMPLSFLQNESVPAILIPMLQQAQREGRGPKLLVSLSCALTLVACLMMLAAQALGALWIDAVLDGFSAEGKEVTLSYVRIMSLAMPASVLANTLAAGEIVLGETRLSNLRAALLNVAVIVGLVVYIYTGWFEALAWSFSASFIALALYGLWRRHREGTLDPSGLAPWAVLEAAREFFRRLRPLLALPFAEQAQVWVERLATSRNVVGSVSSVDYARTLSDTALLLVSQPVGLAYMSSYRKEDGDHHIEGIVRFILAIAVPASAFVFVFAPDMVRLVFFRGAFSETGLVLTSSALRGVSIGLWASTLGWILLRRLNSEGRNALATLIVCGAYAANIALNGVAAWAGSSMGFGLLLIGLGESARSFTLLAGATAALPNRRRVASLIAGSLSLALPMLAAGWLIETRLDAALPRVLAGGAACAICVVVGLCVLLPDMRRLGVARLREWVSRGGAT